MSETTATGSEQSNGSVANTTTAGTTSIREQAREVLVPLLESRARITPITQLYGPSGLQAPADPRYVFELRKNGSRYSVHATDSRATFIPEVEGNFIYVVRADDPGRIFVALDRALAAPGLRQYGVQGHTSFDQGSDVLYAGEVSFDQGRLVGWDNASGHYRPAADVRHTNMLPVVRAMLPESAFGGAQRPMTLKVGRLDIPVEELRAMGARVDRRPLWTALLEDGVDSVQADLANRLQFDSEYLVGAHRAPRAPRNTEILLELIAVRSSDAPLLTNASGNTLVAAMQVQLGRLKDTLGRVARGVKSNVVTHLMPGGGMVRHTGISMQVFGIYNSVRGLSLAIERGDTAEGVMQAAGLAAQPASLAAEALIPALGKYLQAGNVARFNAFAASGLGQRLGGMARLGTNIGRAGGATGALISTPFDIYNAVSAFRQAGQSGAADGGAAQDHYVNGGLATASAVASVGAAAAAFAGVSAAGPVGVVLGLAMAVGSGIYHSVRYVDDLDRHAGLTAGERFTTGLLSFLGSGASQEIEDRAAISRAREAYTLAKQQQLRTILSANNWSDAIYGGAIITPQAPVAQASSSFFVDIFSADGAVDYIQQPARVIDNAADDNINASAGLDALANVVRRNAGNPTVLWATGDGRDRLLGVTDRSNIFSLRNGVKAVRGGDRDDLFVLGAIPGAGSVFDGGDGSDTLVLSASGTGTDGSNATARVTLDWYDESWEWDSSPDTYLEEDESGHQVLRNKAGARVSPTPDAGRLSWGGGSSLFRSIENVVTSAGIRTRITGNDRDNLFVLNGHGDSATGTGGNDTYIVNGTGSIELDAGDGNNSYRIARSVDNVEIWSRSRQDRVLLDFDFSEIAVRAVGNDLSVALEKESETYGNVIFRGWFRFGEDRAQEARRNDGQLRLWTRDGFALAPLLSSIGRAEDGLIDLAATPASGPEAQAMDLLIQYASAFDASSAAVGGSAGAGTAGSMVATPLSGTPIQSSAVT
jgi:hypothetical protein